MKLIKIDFILVTISIGIIFILYSLINISSYSVANVEKYAVENNLDVKEPVDVLVEKPITYLKYPTKGDYIGTVSIPSTNATFPLYEGTSSAELKKGVGHFIDSVLPGIKDNVVISGHKNTIFKKIDKVVIGDIIIVNTELGEFTYEVIGIRIVDRNDKTVIVPTTNAMLTITTCYPFYFVGRSPDRYIVSAKLIAS